MEKQLKEIEIPFGAKDSELCGWEYTIPEGMEATIVDNKIIVQKKESEDERIRKAIIATIHLYYGEPLEDEAKEMIAWLEKKPSLLTKEKALKNSPFVEQNPAWSEEDEKQARQIERIVRNDGCTQKLQKQIADWLKSLKNRVQPQPKQEWNEEDEKCIENAIMYCKWARDIAPNLHCYEISEKSINWLKSFKERYTWKPSDEQIEMLENVRKILHTNDIYSKANHLMYNFEELIRTLKKLKDEK